MQIRWLATALRNLDEEAEYIAKESPTAARTVVATIISSIQMLKDNPSLGRPGRVNGTKELIVPNTRYIVPYRVRSKTGEIQILRVFHTSRKPPKNWK